MYKSACIKNRPPTILFRSRNPVKRFFADPIERFLAHLFRAEILLILIKIKDQFAMRYGTGRPNFSVARMLGLCLLQELNLLSDQQSQDAFDFYIRWRCALDVSDKDAYLLRRSLVEFRRRLATKDPDMAIVRTIFEGISKSAIKKLGLSSSERLI